MTRRIFGSLLLSMFVLCLLGTASAEEIYVKNKVFKGDVLGSGMSSEVSLSDLATALGLEFKEENGQWLLGDVTVPGREQDGKIFVPVKALKEAGYRVMHSPELGTIDIAVPKAVATGDTGRKKTPRTADTGNWGNKPTLVYYGASW